MSATAIGNPATRRFEAAELGLRHVLIRGGGVVVGVAALVVIRGTGVPAQPLLAGIGFGIIAGAAPICRCLALDYLPICRRRCR